jgi:hypothetical protein
MPDQLWDITDKRTGRTITVRGAEAPTEDDAEELFKLEALEQSKERPGQYFGEAAGNVGGDILTTLGNLATGAADLLGTGAGAVREAVGLDEGSGDIDKLKGLVPGMVEHYGGYLDPGERRRRIRDNPVGTVVDLLPIGGALSRVPGMVASMPGRAMAAGTLRGAAKVAPGVGALVGGGTGAAMGDMTGAVAGGFGGWAAGGRAAQGLENVAERLRPRPEPPLRESGLGSLEHANQTLDRWFAEFDAKQRPAQPGPPPEPPAAPGGINRPPTPEGPPPGPAPPGGAQAPPVAPPGNRVQMGGRDIELVLSERAAEAGRVLAPVEVTAFDRAWAQDPGFHIDPTGKGAIGTRLEGVRQHLASADVMDAPEVTIEPNGRVGVSDGRHRMAVLRDAGVGQVPAAMSEESLANARAQGLVRAQAPQPPQAPEAPAAPAAATTLESETLARLQAEYAQAQAKLDQQAEALAYLLDNKVSPNAVNQTNLGDFKMLGFRDVFDYARELAKATENEHLIEALSRASQRLHQTGVKTGRPRRSYR